MNARLPLRVGTSLAVAVLAVLAATGCGTSHASTATSTASGVAGTPRDATLSSISSDDMLQVGTRVLVTARGYALYVFVPDHQHAVTCVALCAVSWPPAYQAGGSHVSGSKGVDVSLIGSATDPDHKQVVTYNDWPLYTYAADPQPGYAAGQGIDLDGGYWYLMRPDGRPLVPAGEPPAAGRSTP